jgi:hypothetical protein
MRKKFPNRRDFSMAAVMTATVAGFSGCVNGSLSFWSNDGQGRALVHESNGTLTANHPTIRV